MLYEVITDRAHGVGCVDGAHMPSQAGQIVRKQVHDDGELRPHEKSRQKQQRKNNNEVRSLDESYNFV